MTLKLKNKLPGLKSLLASVLMLAALAGNAQDRSAVIADPKLNAIVLTDFDGYPVDPTNLQADQLIKLKLPVACDNHGKILPAGSCKIKIGLGSKLVLDPGFDLNNAGMGDYFRWTVMEEAGQFQVTGELINPLPVSITAVDLSFRIKVKEAGSSAVTANFLITNHNTTAILSDENGSNNATALSYKVSDRIPVDPSTGNGKLKLSLYPNPVKNVNTVKISVVQGTLKGNYKIIMYDMAGKLIQSKDMQLDFATSFLYNFGNIAAGKYMVKVVNTSGTESAILKFEKF
ncbi:MAG: T9SS type A sorting domain-containing protein [Ferruginibacter sp.]